MDFQEKEMERVSITDAKTPLEELVGRVAAGEHICITRRGKPVARLIPVEARRLPIDVAMLQAVTDGMEPQSESGGDFIRRMRDEDRY